MTRRGLSRTQVTLGIAIVLGATLITVPLWMNTSKKSHRAEVPLNVDEIRQALLTYHGAFEEYVSATAAPRSSTEVDDHPVAWRASEGFVKLAWEPKEPSTVYGAYEIIATDDDFTVTGTCDVDGDGELAIYRATLDEPAKRITADDVY